MTKRDKRLPVPPVEKAIRAKRKLIARLDADIADVRQCADEQVMKIQGRISIAKMILAALQKGDTNEKTS